MVPFQPGFRWGVILGDDLVPRLSLTTVRRGQFNRFFCDLMGFHGGLMVINGGLISGKHTKNYGKSPFVWKIHHKWEFLFFPRASERRVLPIVGVCISSSHLLTFSSSHLLSHLLIFTSSHLLIFTPSLTSSHLHIFSSSHLLIFTSSHLHIFSSSHLHIFTYSQLLFLSLSLSHSHLHILTSSLSLSSFLSPFSLSFLSPFSLFRLLYLSLFRPRVVPAGSHET